MTTLDVLLFDGCEALDAIGPLEVLGYSGLKARPRRLDGAGAVRTAQGLTIQGEAPHEAADWLIVPGGGWDEHADHADQTEAITECIQKHAERGGKLGAVCTGTMWLALAGMIGSRPATTHHWYWDELAQTGADVRRGERVVDDGDLVTSGGVTSGLFLGLHLIQRLLGADARARVEAEIELPEIPNV